MVRIAMLLLVLLPQMLLLVLLPLMLLLVLLPPMLALAMQLPLALPMQPLPLAVIMLLCRAVRSLRFPLLSLILLMQIGLRQSRCKT